MYMDITENQLFDYITCPAYYDMKYVKRINAKKGPTMQRLLENVSNHFYTNLLNKKICSMDELKRKWDSVCNKNKDYINSKRNLEGINYIVNFARWASDNRIVLVDFQSDYTVNIDNIRVHGTIGPVAALPGRKCELIVNRFSNREPDQHDLDKRLKYTLDCYAFKEAYNHNIDAIRLVHFKNNKEFTSSRSQMDYDRLESTIKGAANGIRSEAFYPRESNFCSSCEMKSYCKYWS